MADDNITITRDPDPYDYDGIWKDFTREFWRDVLCDFMPELYVAADLEREAEQLEKELHDILADLDTEAEKTPKRYVDNLLKIYLKDSSEEWVLLHIEIQGRGRGNISLRMFRYHCLILTHYGRHPAAMAILTAKRPKKEGEPGKYTAELFGTLVEYTYRVIKAYEFKDEGLKARNTKPALFIYALKKSAEHRRSDREKLEYMKEIIRLAAKQGMNIRERRMFMIFVERSMKLKNKELQTEFHHEYNKAFEEGNIMRYKGILERSFELMDAFDEGEAQGRAQERAKTIREFACKLLGLGTFSDEQIADLTNQPLEDIAVLRQELAAASH